jgi:hypothetical protein
MKILKSVVKRVIGDHHLLRLRRAAKRLKHFGLVRFCPCCKARLRRFIPFGLIKRPEAKCAVCESLERHRLMCSMDSTIRIDLCRQASRLRSMISCAS